MFRATNWPILRSTFWLCIELWYNAPTPLPTDATVEMELTFSQYVVTVGYAGIDGTEPDGHHIE